MDKLVEEFRKRINDADDLVVYLSPNLAKGLLAHIERLDSELETMHGVIANALVVADLPEWLRIDAWKAIRPRAKEPHGPAS